MEKTIEEKIRDAEKAVEEVAKFEPDEIKAAKGLGVESMQSVEVISAGQVYIYDTRTGDRSICNRNNLAHALQKRRPDNSLVFTTIKPKVKPKRGMYKCMLHPDERKPLYDVWGLTTCFKDNLTSPFQVRRHMQKRHKVEYETIREEEKREEQEKNRKVQEALMKSATKGK